MRRWGFGMVGAAVLVLMLAGPAGADFLGGEGQDSPKQKLKGLFVTYWDDEMRSNPLDATYNGDHRYDDRLPDPSAKAYRAKLARHRKRLEALKGIDPRELDADDRIDREVLMRILADELAGERFGDYLIPITQQRGLHLSFPQSVNSHPSATIGDYLNYRRRLQNFSWVVDETIRVMRQGMKEDRMPPRVALERVVPQLRALAKPKAEDSPLWGLVDRMPADWPEAERKRMTEPIRKAIEDRVIPAYVRLADFVEKEYLPACRESIGLCETPDGAEHYAYLAGMYTTTDLTPDQIHQLGLAEGKKARAALDEVRRRVGFEGDLPAFFAHLRTDPKFQNHSEKEILGRYTTILEAIDAKLPELFGHLPRTDYGIHTIEAYRAEAAAAGYYHPPPEDGSRPGYFYVNTFDPESRPTYTMQDLAYHESVPGHHLQFALALEAPNRPAFRRFGYFSSFSEGWALYAEGLPEEVGLYSDPYAAFGRWVADAWRSARLVVDTGMHDRGWGRDQAIRYMEENTSLPRLEIESEIDRYIAWPGQALAYKIGALKIRELRDRAEQRLGDRFDLRSFHDRILAHGSLPLGVLENVMEGEEAP